MIARIIAAVVLTALLSGAAQKFRTFYSLNDPAVPLALNSTPQKEVVATDGAAWRIIPDGLIRTGPQSHVQYFSGKRYLPDNHVLALLPDRSAGVWVKTETAVSHIEFRPMTLAEKANFFEDRIHKRHDRHGFVSPSTLLMPGDLSTSVTRDDDNDGLWTSLYAAAECFRYAATRSPKALASAKKSIEAVLFLEQVTGAHGFPARSYIVKGEPMPHDGQWHWTPGGKYYWKGDTSSDEIVGHFFLYGIAFDLIPDPSLKHRIAATAARIADHILDHGYELIDVSGRPTRWGRWSPQYFRQAPEDSPLNALEILSFLRVASHITNNPRYQSEYSKLAYAMGYAKLTTRYLELRDEINYSDEELAMLSFYSLLRYGAGPGSNRWLPAALSQWWQNIAREQNPFWTLIHAMPHPSPSPLVAERLSQMPLDTIDWSVANARRPDIEWEPTPDRFHHKQSKTLLPYDELPIMKWNANPFVVDSDSTAASEDDGTAFLLPYWMARYCSVLGG